MPDAEREAAMVPIREFAAKIKKGEINMEQAGAVGKALAEGPLPMVMMARAAELMYLEPSDLPAAEKEAGSITISRFAHGITQKKIGEAEVDAAFDKISTKGVGTDGNESVQLKDSLTDGELREWLATMKKSADKARIAKKRFTVDIPAEIRKAIDAGLGENSQ